MPTDLARRYARDMPRLQAQENILQTLTIGVGMGTLAKEHARQIMSGWVETAKLDGRRRRRKGAPTEAELMVLGSMGVKVRKAGRNE